MTNCPVALQFNPRFRRSPRSIAILSGLLLWTAMVLSDTRVMAQAAETNTVVVVVVGASGEQEYTKQFSKWANDWRQLAAAQGWRHAEIGPPSEESKTGSSDSNANSDTAQLQSTITNLQKLESTFQSLAAETESKSTLTQLWLVMIGHGTAAGKLAKFNLVGPDVTSLQLKGWLDKIACETVVIDCTSSSAPFLVELSSKNRIVVSATRSGAEINYARFGGYFAQALQDAAADLDHDHEVSLLEAFLKASKETEKFYRENSRLATEHALLEDNSDRTGTSSNFYVGAVASATAAGGKPIDGRRSSRIILWSSPESVRLGPEQLAQREQIEAEIDKLRDQKKSMKETDYFEQLELLMLKMNAIYESVDKK